MNIDKPFFVLATQNPIEQEGTYPLPEAQLDRFMFNVLIDYPPFKNELDIVKSNTSKKPSIKLVVLLANPDIYTEIPKLASLLRKVL